MVFLALAASDSLALPPTSLTIAPINPEFTAWQSKVATLSLELRDAEGHALGLVPSPIDRSHLLTQTRVFTTQLDSIPSSYDLRTLGYVTPVKNQGGCGSCWSFASYGSLESCLLKSAAETWDFSENHLKNYHGFDYAPCEGGDADMSTAYLARWSGPVSEADDPYHDWDDRPSPGGICRKYVERVLWFFTASDIKNALMTYGGMYVSMCWDSAYYNSSQYTYYYNGSESDNHAITLIGWDDNKVVAGAPGNGAWLVKNSWGIGWGNNGYFWISYYDSIAVSDAVAFCDAVSTSSYTTNYQYDPLGWVTSLGYTGSSTAWAANIFIPTANEQLKAVGLYAVSNPTSYVIYVYDNFNGSTFSNLLGSVSGTLADSGYYTIPLASPINLTTGNNFAIVVKFTTTGYDYPVPVEMDIAGYSSGATANPGQSYLSSTGGAFTDITAYYGYENTNVCIRALTTICAPPLITQHPEDVSVFAGQDANFSVTASGTMPLHYQWKKNGSNVGSDSPTLILYGVQSTDDGAQITCVVSNACGTATSNTAILTVSPGEYSGGSGTSTDPYRIASAEDLNDIGNHIEDWDKHFILVNDVNLAEFTGRQFNRIGTDWGSVFTGVFDGNDHKIWNFTWSSDGINYIGLFGYVGSGGQIKNLGMENVDVNNAEFVVYVGGLVGRNEGEITNCYSTGNITRWEQVGGLVGFNGYNGTITECYSTASVSGGMVGGLVGVNGGTIIECYSTGSVTGDWGVGGLVGYDGGAITNCYSTGSVTGDWDVGGLVGYDEEGVVTASFWDVNTSSQSTSASGTSKTTVEMKTKSTFTDAGWDFVNIWDICEGTNYPRLRWQIPFARARGDFLCPYGVDLVDFAVLTSAWQSEPSDPDWNPACDISQPKDNFIDELDLAVLCENWLEGTTP